MRSLSIWPDLAFTETGLSSASSLHFQRDIGLAPERVETLHLRPRLVTERFVAAGVVEPPYVFEDGELEL